MVGRRLASGGRIDRGRPHLGPDGSGEPTFPGDSPTAVFLAAGRMVARTSPSGRPRGIVRDGQIDGATLAAGAGSGSPAGPIGDCDVLVVGAGPAGLSAALSAARTGVRVTLVDRAAAPGGSLLSDEEIAWATETAAELAGLGVDLVLDAEVTAIGEAGASRREQDGGADGTGGSDGAGGTDRADGSDGSDAGTAAGRTVHLRRGGVDHRVAAGRVVLATGATERPVLFPGNGTPGVLPAETVRAFLLRYGVLAGEQVVLLAAHDDAYRVAGDLLAVGASVAVVDPRPDPDGGPAARFADRPGPADLLPTGAVLFGTMVAGVATDGSGVLTGVELRAADGTRRTVLADLLAVSGGWNPDVALFAGAGGRVRFDAERGAYLPDADLEDLHVVGSARGLRTSAECVADGAGAGGLKGLSGELVVLPPPVDLQPVRTPPVVLAVDPSAADDGPAGAVTLLDPAAVDGPTVDRTVPDVLATLPTPPTGPDPAEQPLPPTDALTRVLAASLAGLGLRHPEIGDSPTAGGGTSTP